MTGKHHHDPSGAEADRARALERDGRQLLAENRWDEALQHFGDLLHIDAASEGGLQGKIACLRKLRRYDEAARLIETALQLHPKSVGVLSERAWLDVERGNYDQAIVDFREVLQHPQKDEGAWVWLISLLRTQRRFDEAENSLREAQELFSNGVPLSVEDGWLSFAQDRYEEAGDTFESILRKDRNNESAMQGQIASLRLRGKYAEAMRQSRRALAAIPKSPGILSEVGWLEFEQSHFEEAELAFAQVVALAPTDPRALLNLAWSLERQDDREALAKASKYCRQALVLDPALPEAKGCLGMVAFRQGRIRDAEDQFVETITMNPAKGHYADLGALYIQMGRYDEAEKRLKEGVLQKKDESALHLQLGNLYMQTDRLKDATAEFRQAAALDPTHPDPPRALAIALLEAGKVAEAEIVLRSAVRALDENKRWRLHLTLSEVLTRMAEDTSTGQLLDEALKQVNAALRLQPDHADPRFYAGIVRFKLEDYRGSLRAFERCHEADKSRVDAEINARRVRTLIQQERSRSRASVLASAIVGVVVLVQLIAIWALRWRYGAGNDALVNTTMITVLVPVCLGLLVVSVVLPWLSKLKLTGLEAELSKPEPKRELASGPKGEISFDRASRPIVG
jgi:tetratricopeptide (TPR) repeat protein